MSHPDEVPFAAQVMGARAVASAVARQAMGHDGPPRRPIPAEKARAIDAERRARKLERKRVKAARRAQR
jgi:hypothetical protein